MTTFTIDQREQHHGVWLPRRSRRRDHYPVRQLQQPAGTGRTCQAWPAERLVAIWNSLPGVEPVKSFKTSKAAASRIWERIQGLGAVAKPEVAPAKPKADKTAKGGARSAKGASAKAKTNQKDSAAKRPKGKTAVKAQEATAPREGSKTAQVVAMLQRKNGATLTEDHGKDGLAKSHRPRVHGRHDEEGRIRRRVLQIRQGRAHLPDQPVASNVLPSWPARHCRGGLFCFWSRFLPDPRKSRQSWPTRRTGATRTNVGQLWRNEGQTSATVHAGLHAATFRRSPASSSKERPSRSSTAWLPVYS